MSINSSLIKLANKIDTENISNVEPDYKNPNNSIEKSIERIADNYSGSGGGGGGGGGALIVHESNDTLDKTWKEIHDATLTSVVVLVSGDEVETIIDYCANVGINDPGYYVAFISERYYATSSENGYPVRDL